MNRFMKLILAQEAVEAVVEVRRHEGLEKSQHISTSLSSTLHWTW